MSIHSAVVHPHGVSFDQTKFPTPLTRKLPLAERLNESSNAFTSNAVLRVNFKSNFELPAAKNTRPNFTVHSLIERVYSNSKLVESDGDELGESDYVMEEQQDELEVKENNSETTGFVPLTNAEKKALRAYAHQMGKDIVTQQVGKWGVTPSLSRSINDTLEKNEIIKMRIMENCPMEMDEIMFEIQTSTNSQIFGKIGRTLLIYKPSLKKFSKPQSQDRDETKKNFTPKSRSFDPNKNGQRKSNKFNKKF